MKNTAKIILGGIALAVALVACPSTPPGGTGATPKVGDKPLSQQDATKVSALAPSLASGMVTAFKGGALIASSNPGLQIASLFAPKAAFAAAERSLSRFAVKPAQLVAAATCPATSGNTTDADGDGIPVDATLTYTASACSGTSGTITLRDKNDGDINSGYIATINLNISSTDATLVYKESVDVSTSAAGYGAAFSFELTYTSGSDSFTMKYNMTMSFTPSPDQTPDQFDNGALAFDGTFYLSATSGGQTDSLAFRMWTPQNSPLMLSTSCADGFLGGQMYFSDSATKNDANANILAITYSSTCGQATATYNGQPLQ